MSTLPPTSADFTAAYPQFDTYVGLEAQLALSVRLLSVDAWGDFYSDGVMLDCAHNLFLNNLAATGNGPLELAAGPISSVSGGGVSVSFNSPAVDTKRSADSWYQKTSYGQQFLRLRNAVVSLADIAS